MAFSDLREAISDRVGTYKILSGGPHGQERRDRFCAGVDVLLEGQAAAKAYEKVVDPNDPGICVLAAYGFLNALNVMHDAVISMNNAVEGPERDAWENVELSKIRRARNIISGHPSYADRLSNGLQAHTAFFDFGEFTAGSFTAVIWPTVETDISRAPELIAGAQISGRSVIIVVNVSEWREVFFRELTPFLKSILDSIDSMESKLGELC
ncbi:MAG: hypothetical protein AAFR11_15280 [Pseudomonadota bacterium]